MGLIERIQSGSLFKRGEVAVSSVPATGNFTNPGATYILLGISSTEPCRVRLYGESASVAIDAGRPSSSFDYSASVALNLDAGLTPGSQSVTFTPPIFASTDNSGSIPRTWYNIESTNPATVTISYYPIELDTTTRQWLTIPNNTGVTLGTNVTSSGEVVSPKSFIILNTFFTSSANLSARLRLYSRPIADIDNTEKNRAFITQPASDSHLIADLLYDVGDYLYPVSPILQAYNLENYLSGSNRVGYILENTAGSSQSNMKIAVNLCTVED